VTSGRAILWAALLLPLAARGASADFSISLREGTTVIAKSYRIDGDKVVAYTVSGEVRIESSRVMNIRDRGTAGPTEAAEPAAGPTPRPAATPRLGVDPQSPFLTVDEARTRDRELARALILAHRDLLFAENRGESQAELDRRRTEIEKLDSERSRVRAVLGPTPE
jgi:hypothetical protein